LDFGLGNKPSGNPGSDTRCPEEGGPNRYPICHSAAGLPDFSWSKHTKMGKIYQMTTNHTKRLYIIPNGRKILQMVMKSTNKYSF
jgi:hypothetical protein